MNAEQRNRVRSEAKRLVESFRFIAPLPDYPTLVKRACHIVEQRNRNHREWLEIELGYDNNPLAAPTDVQTRWVRNYIRHYLSNYESLLAEIEAQDRHGDGYKIIRDAIDRKIDAAIRELL